MRGGVGDRSESKLARGLMACFLVRRELVQGGSCAGFALFMLFMFSFMMCLLVPGQGHCRLSIPAMDICFRN